MHSRAIGLAESCMSNPHRNNGQQMAGAAALYSEIYGYRYASYWCCFLYSLILCLVHMLKARRKELIS